jgi:hypothetical protein
MLTVSKKTRKRLNAQDKRTLAMLEAVINPSQEVLEHIATLKKEQKD